MAVNLSPSMSLPVPGVGTEAGPAYATDVNNCLTILDAHDHSPGSGIPVTPDGLNINIDLSMNSQNLYLARSIRFAPQAATLALPSDVGCIYESGVDLYFNDGNGTPIRITQSGGIAGTPGSIANLAPPASAAYVAANKTFVWQSDSLTPANLDAASVVLRNLLPSSFGLTLLPPSLSSDYNVTLPQLPASTLPISITASGTMSAQPVTFAQLDSTLQAKIVTPPTVQKFLSGSGTYTLPTSPVTPTYIRVRMVGGGGGGSGAALSVTNTAGGAGGDTSFGSLVAGGGAGGQALSGAAPGGGAGGAATVPGIIGFSVNGSDGSPGNRDSNSLLHGTGGSGGPSYFGGAGGGGVANAVGLVARPNSGSGGGGCGQINSFQTSGGGGGGSGAYVEAIIYSPSPTYSYSVGTGGAGGSPGGGGVSGGAGAAGQIIVEEYYG